MQKSDVGIIGLGVMGKNLALNIESRDYAVSLYNRSSERTDDFLNGEGLNKSFHGTYRVEEFIQSLERPRQIILLVKAGEATDETIQQLVPYLDEEDVIIDSGNSHFKDTMRRNEKLAGTGVHFMDISFSGGAEGALNGPAIMPGGSKKAFETVAPLLSAISAKVDGSPCFTHLGPSGAGHYVKMVHNGIEYSDMQLISEAYFILKHILGLSAEELHEVFAEWNKGDLESYLIEITADILTRVDEETASPLIDMILDTAAQKGTGKWASQNALDLGVPLSIGAESVFARIMSSLKDEREIASQNLLGPEQPPLVDQRTSFIELVRKALYMAKVCAYAQGFMQMKAASKEYGWALPYGEVAMTFRGGCVIQAQFLDKIKSAFDQDPSMTNLLLDSYFKEIVESYQFALRKVISTAVEAGVPVPALSSALSYYDSYRTDRLPANLLQAQRDYFGAHSYQRIDKEGTFHTDW
ncbi:NADP-dependent phosphogluconate dehydrogenase [Texcoconibacillus texcoconensis]|uniref:6-phosphogluconate dehydrogenase, decarboxylating n=1 Tax=Texcoconibacillus texcoconensis TaxID=1095777 RepID=A0A840QR42_9BACI|nr:6-phosphogluconate dehydrogenase [Texcoconibacillus texcoconensis]